MKIAELRTKSKEELKELILNYRKERFNLRMQSATGALENRSRMGEARKDIARALTLLNEKPGGTKKQPKAPKMEKTAKTAAPAKKKTAKAKKEE